jgi:hypothetical protein
VSCAEASAHSDGDGRAYRCLRVDGEAMKDQPVAESHESLNSRVGMPSSEARQERPAEFGECGSLNSQWGLQLLVGGEL